MQGLKILLVEFRKTRGDRNSSAVEMLGYTRNSAIADKPRDAFRGQSRSPNIVPFDMLGMVSY